MGLMSWLRGGRSGGDSDAVPAAPAGRVEVEGQGDRDDRVDRVDRVDVRRLVPMQRTVSEQDLVINPVAFQGALSTRQATALGTPLGHLVSPDAPTGVLHGVTSPVPGSPVPSAQRSVEMPSRRTSGGKGTPAGRGGSSDAVPAAVSAAVPAVVPVPVPESTPVPTSVSVSVPEAVPVQRASSPMTSAGTSDVADLPVRQLVGEQPLVATGTPPPPRESAQPPSEPAPQPRRTPGLGAPLAGLPPTAQRQAAAAVPGSGAPEASSGPVVRPPEVGSVPPSVAPLLGDDPLVGSVLEGEGEGQDRSAGESAGEAEAPVQRFVGSATRPTPPLVPPPTAVPTSTVPLLGDRPLTPRTTTVQRAARGGGEPPRTGPPPAPPPVPVRWTTSGPPSSATPSPSAAVPVQRSAAVPVQRQAAGGPPVPGSVARTGSGARLPTAGAFAVAAGVAQRMPDGSVVFGSSSTSSAPSASPSSGSSQPVVQRDAELAEEPPPPDSAPASAPAGEAEPEPEPASENASADDGGSPAPPLPGAAPGRPGVPAVTDELVRALYAPLSRLLKADLRLERERAGFLINTRH